MMHSKRFRMASLQGPVICSVVRSKQTRIYSLSVDAPVLKAEFTRSRFRGLEGLYGGRISVACRQHMRRCRTIHGSFSSSSDGNGNVAGNPSGNDANYVNSSVIEAVEVRSGPYGFWIKMRDGRYLRCAPNNPQGGHMRDSAPHPAIVLKMEDGTGLLFPILVPEMSNAFLMAAVCNVQIARPTVYQVVKNMVEKLGYTVNHARVTKRAQGAYFAEVCLAKLDSWAESVCFDLRPSDAINIAIRCKVPIQVHKYLAYSDGVRVIESTKESSVQRSSSDRPLFTEFDRPTARPCIETEEFDLVRNMLIAVAEERYTDAASWRDKLMQLRSRRNST